MSEIPLYQVFLRFASEHCNKCLFVHIVMVRPLIRPELDLIRAVNLFTSPFSFKLSGSSTGLLAVCVQTLRAPPPPLLFVIGRQLIGPEPNSIRAANLFISPTPLLRRGVLAVHVRTLRAPPL